MRISLFALLLAGCQSPPVPSQPFPDGFVWGSATAGFQVDMGCPTLADDACNDTASDWYQWVTDPRIVGNEQLFVAGEPVSVGPGMWELFEDDARQMRRDHLSGFRMSLEWSRLFPDAAAEQATTVDALDAHANADAVERYHQMFAALADNGIHPLVTLNHYTLPLWVHDGAACHEDPDSCAADGWVSGERIVPLIALYAGWCAREFGGEVDQWATLNEPFATTLSGYMLPGEARSGPPGLFNDGPRVVASLQHQIEGHAAMYDAVHANDTQDADADGLSAEVGLVLNMVDMVPKDPDRPADVEATDKADYLYHRVFLDAITEGAWDPDLDGTPDQTRADLADRLDYLGINYYNEVLVTGTSLQLLPEVPVATFIPEFSWDAHPEGLGRVVEVASGYGRPIVITENGTPHVDASDTILVDHLDSLHGAIEAGHDVRGYYAWSWVDNYEWNHGMDLRFGLYELRPNKERVPRPVIERYRDIAWGNGLP